MEPGAEIRRSAGARSSCRRVRGWPSLEAARAGHQAITGWAHRRGSPADLCLAPG